MKKLISSLAGIPFSAVTQQFSEHLLQADVPKTVMADFTLQNGYQELLAMDMKTHGFAFSTEKPIVITKVGYKAWKTGLPYCISLWEVGQNHALNTCFFSPRNTGTVEFFTLKTPVAIESGKIYYITRTYVEAIEQEGKCDCIGWLKNKERGSVQPEKQQILTLINGFFSDDVNPLKSDRVSNIRTNTLMPLVDFEYTLHYP